SKDVKISAFIPENGGGMEGSDYIDFFYKINGGAEVWFGGYHDDIPGTSGQTVSIGGLNGNSVQIVVRSHTTGGNAEEYYFDDVIVQWDDGTTEPTVTNDTEIQATITNLQTGIDTFRYVVYGGYGGCIDESEMTVTRDHSPGTAALTTGDQGFCETSSLAVVANAPVNNGTGKWTTTLGSGSFDSDISPSTTVNSIGYGTNNYTWTLDGEFGVCTSSDVLVIDRYENPTVDVSISTDPDFLYCWNETASLDGQPAHGVTAGAGSSFIDHEWTGTAVDAGYLNTPTNQTALFTAGEIASEIIYTLYYTVEDNHNCVATSPVENLTVHPRLVSVSIGNDSSICDNKPMLFSFNVDGGTAPFDININDDRVNPPDYAFNPVIAANIDTWETPINIRNDYPDYTWTIVDITDDNGCTTTNFLGSSATVIVGASLDDATMTGGTDVCDGTDANLVVNVSGGAPPYTVILDTTAAAFADPGQKTITDYVSGTNISRDLPVGDNHRYRISSVEDACGNIINPAPSEQIINVKPIPVLTSATPASQLICNDAFGSIVLVSDVMSSTFDFTVSSVPAPGPYVWSKAPANGSLTDSEPNGTETITQQLQHNHDEIVTVTYEIEVTGPGIGCVGNTIFRDVVVEPVPVITSPATKTICDGANTDITVTTTTTTSNETFYKWVVVSAGANITGEGDGHPVNGTPLGTKISQDLFNGGTDDQDVTYRITPWTGTAFDNLLCEGSPIVVVVTVEPTPVITSPPAKTICDGAKTDITVTTTTATSNETFYKWVVVSAGGNITGESHGPAEGTPLGTKLDQELFNGGSVDQDVTYSITPWTGSDASTLLCEGSPIVVVVTVEPTPVISSSPTKTICNGDGTNISITTSTSTNNTTYYKWIVKDVGGNITNALNGPPEGTGLGLPINQALGNTGLVDQTVTYEITPWTGLDASTLLCSGSPIEVIVTVEPTPAISSPNKTICNDASTAISVTPLTSTSNTTYYKWIVKNVGANISNA
ncbi:PKD-like domain-containing protein, partial [Bacteroidota bacterium]